MKKLVVILAVALLTGGMVAALLWQLTQDEREANATLQARVTALEARLPATPAPAAAAAPNAEQPAAAAADSAAPTTALPAEQLEAMSASLRQMMASPEGREMTRAQARMTMGRMYPYLGAELGMSPAEVDKFYDLLARQQSELVADMALTPAESALDNAAAQEMQRQLAERRQANEAEISAALGSKYPQWMTYQQNQPIRQQVAQLQSLLGGDGDALSDTQARSLVTTLAAETARIDEERRNAPRPTPPATREEFLAQQEARQEQRRTEANRRLLEAAAAHLTPQQAASYKRMLEQQQQMERALMRSMNAQTAAQGQAAGAAATTPR
jgi:hypothetical protein